MEEQAFYDTHSISSSSQNSNAVEKADDDAFDVPYKVRPFLLNQVLDCWRTCWRDQTLDTPPTEMIGIMDDFETRGLYPDNRSYTLIVEGMILRGDPFETPIIAQWLFDRRMELFDESIPETCPDNVFVTTVMRAWAKSGRIEAPEIVNELFEFMESLSEKGWKQARPDSLAYTSCLEAWQRSFRPEACDEMENILEKMKDDRHVNADRVAYMHVINAWANSKARGSAFKALRLLREMILLYSEGNEHVKPDHTNFSKVMYALIESGHYDEVGDLSDELEELYLKTGDPSFAENAECDKALVIAYAKCNLPYKAQGVLDSLIEEAQFSESTDLMPKRSYFVDVLVSWVRGDHIKNNAEKAHELLFRMIELSKNGHPDLLPDSKCFEKVIQAWAYTKNNTEVGVRAEDVFRSMDRLYKTTGDNKAKPTSRTIELVMTAVSRANQPKASKKVRSLFYEMKRRYAEGDTEMKPGRGAYTILMLALRKSRGRGSSKMVREVFDAMRSGYDSGDLHLRPDLFVYNILIDSLADRGDIVRVKYVMHELLNDYGSGNNAAKPDVRTFNNILRAFSKASTRTDCAFEAEEILHQMESLGIQANSHTFHEMAFIWSKSAKSNAASRAERYFHQIKDRGRVPSLSAYKAVIEAWTSSDDPRSSGRSEAILNELLEAATSNRFRRPNYAAYRNLLHSIACSSIPGRSNQAAEMLKSLSTTRHVPSELLPKLPEKNEK